MELIFLFGIIFLKPWLQNIFSPTIATFPIGALLDNKTVPIGSSIRDDVFTPKYEAAFSGKVNAVSQACLCLGGKLQKQLAGADLTFEMPVMGDFSVLFQFWDADEEFSAKILLLWDKVSLSYLHFETTFYLQGDLLEAILQKINA